MGQLDWKKMLRLAAFVSPHGFGHAARTAAILEALGERRPELEVDLWTSVPPWFFRESLTVPWRYRELVCDVGLAQRTPVEEDLPRTLGALERWWSVEAGRGRLPELASALLAEDTAGVLCDISPLGLAVARAAGLPSILVENFTWDWIYEPLAAHEPGFAPWIERFGDLYAGADLHLQLEPACRPAADAAAIPPVARRPQATPASVRRRLGVDQGRAMILVSLGGIAHRLDRLSLLAGREECVFVLPGAAEEERWERNLRLLPHHSPVHHPDLVAAADVVAGKLGYSTVAESLAAGVPLLYVPRPGFRESGTLEAYVRDRLPAREIGWAELQAGQWTERLPELLALPRPPAGPSRGATVAAARIDAWLAGGRGRV